MPYSIDYFGPEPAFFDTAFFNALGELDVDLVPGTNTSTSFDVRNNETGAITTFTGTGFTYDVDGTPTGGTIETVTFQQGSDTVAAISGLDWSAPDFVIALDALVQGNEAPFNTLLSGDDIVFDGSTATTGAEFGVPGVTSTVTVTGTDFADTLGGGDAADSIVAGEGDDVLDGGPGDDTLDGGAGSDTVFYDLFGADAVTIDLAADVATGTVGGTSFAHSLLSIENAGGTELGADSITGDEFSNELFGRGGDDTLDGADGDDYVEGNEGNDSLVGGAGADTLIGDPGNDTMIGGAGNDLFVGGDGDDRIETGDNDDFDDIMGGRGSDTFVLTGVATGYVQIDYGDYLVSGVSAVIDGTAGTGSVAKGEGDSDAIVDVVNALSADGLGLAGTSFDDSFDVSVQSGQFLQVNGGAGADSYTFVSGDGALRLDFRGGSNAVVADLSTGTISDDGFGNAETLTGSVSELRTTMNDDVVTGSAADERFILEAGNDTVDGGGGFDALRFDRARVDSSVTVDLGAGTASGSWDGAAFSYSVSDIEGVRGSVFGDSLTGDSEGNLLEGNGGDDTLTGGNGDDTLDGGDGSDSAVFAVASGDISGNDLGGGEFEIISSEGTDVVSGVESFTFTDGTLTAADVAAILSATSLIEGTAGADSLSGTAADETIRGFDGDDTLEGAGGDDSIEGGIGNDLLQGGAGADTLRGEDGADRLEGGDGTDTLDGGEGDDVILGGASAADLRDVVFAGGGNDSVDGGYGNDQLSAGDGDDTVLGGFGVDTVIGNAGDDVLTGSAFSDLMFGNDGFDFINGGFGSDRVNGGAGADRFYHLGIADHGSDWIQDFSDVEGDVLLYGGQDAGPEQFQVNYANTAGAGDAGVDEAFVIYRPTGQILWALVDGGGLDSLELRIGGETFDLMA